jgi:hypothetical protein
MGSPLGGKRGRGRGQIKMRGSGAKGANTVRGTCSILESQFNPIPGPCVNTLLVVSDVKGEELARTRTSAKGEFEFTAERATSYRIGSGSQAYEVVSPSDPVQGGSRVVVKLRQK